MNAEIIVYGAQILTGLATLVVAFVLTHQLKQQRSEAQRELVDFTQNIFPGPDTDTLDQTYRRDNTHFNDLGLDRFAELWLEKIRSLP